ncbi:alcohol dehydrogenase [Acuticoccus sediminis]|uniref:Alcohol dehydrogenase n=1 Tax=Acuticoccus sediminis TaxID=2184697 RepID=A0A8B2NDX1_9HYPH|nr:Zn-dependent alcohol dehydrogenase [Acuticoccus sediminis]RAH96779.1 alcohol dehydrogenase [Acuticoccus sediminis]
MSWPGGGQTVKAAVLRAYREPLSVEDVDLLPPQTGEVRIRFAASGVCHSDMTRIEGARPSSLPIVLGHEASGYVEEVGPGVTDLAIGDRVVLSFVYDCGRCFYCCNGRPNLCEVGIGMLKSGTMVDGTTRLRKGDEVIHHMVVSSFAEQAVVPARCATRIPEAMPMDVAALIGCAVLTGTGAVFNTGAVRPGDTMLVVGSGGVGLNVVQAAAIAGARVILVSDLSAEKRRMALDFGATHVVDPREEDPVAMAKSLTGGRGVDFSFEAIGHKATIRQCYDAIRPGGKAIVVGAAEAGSCCEIEALTLPIQEKVLTGSMYGGARPRLDVERLVDLYTRKRLRLDELITRTYRLGEINDALHDLHEGRLARGLIRYE